MTHASATLTRLCRGFRADSNVACGQISLGGSSPKCFTIAGERLLVLLIKSRTFPRGRLCVGPMMDRSTEHAAAKIIPIAAGVDEMQMPSLVDRIGRRHLDARPLPPNR